MHKPLFKVVAGAVALGFLITTSSVLAMNEGSPKNLVLAKNQNGKAYLKISPLGRNAIDKIIANETFARLRVEEAMALELSRLDYLNVQAYRELPIYYSGEFVAYGYPIPRADNSKLVDFVFIKPAIRGSMSVMPWQALKNAGLTQDNKHLNVKNEVTQVNTEAGKPIYVFSKIPYCLGTLHKNTPICHKQK